jgi:hypothetical protein
MKNLKHYSDPGSEDKRQALRDFLSEIVSFLAYDSASTVSFSDIQTAVNLTFDFEVQLAALIDAVAPIPVKQNIVAYLSFAVGSR